VGETPCVVSDHATWYPWLGPGWIIIELRFFLVARSRRPRISLCVVLLVGEIAYQLRPAATARSASRARRPAPTPKPLAQALRKARASRVDENKDSREI
jgi:hypothetical protein